MTPAIIFLSVVELSRWLLPVAWQTKHCVDSLGYFLGNLHFVNILQEDYQNGQRYACIVQNEVTRSVEQGAYTSISPQGRTSK